jgi:hypothetical protein
MSLSGHMTQQQLTPESMIRTMQIIALALPAGVLVFALVAVFGVGALAQPPDGNFLSLFAAGFTVVMFVAHVVVPGSVVGKAIASQTVLPVEVRPYAACQAGMLIKLAFLEGAAFFNVIATIIEHNWWSLGIAGVLVGWMAMNFPTQTRVEHWIAGHRV